MLAATLEDSMSIEKFRLDRVKFLKCYCLNDEQVQAMRLDRSALEAMWAKHASAIADLEDAAEYVFQRLRQIPAVPSLKVRIKHPEHVIAKIIRKKQEKSDFDVSLNTNVEHSSDLIGIRALHLYQGSMAIHLRICEDNVGAARSTDRVPTGWGSGDGPESLPTDSRRLTSQSEGPTR
jgi:hypothetical protein